MDIEELFARADKLVADMKERDRKRFEAMGMTEEEFDEIMETKDEICGLI